MAEKNIEEHNWKTCSIEFAGNLGRELEYLQTYFKSWNLIAKAVVTDSVLYDTTPVECIAVYAFSQCSDFEMKKEVAKEKGAEMLNTLATTGQKTDEALRGKEYFQWLYDIAVEAYNESSETYNKASEDWAKAEEFYETANAAYSESLKVSAEKNYAEISDSYQEAADAWGEIYVLLMDKSDTVQETRTYESEFAVIEESLDGAFKAYYEAVDQYDSRRQTAIDRLKASSIAMDQASRKMDEAVEALSKANELYDETDKTWEEVSNAYNKACDIYDKAHENYTERSKEASEKRSEAREAKKNVYRAYVEANEAYRKARISLRAAVDAGGYNYEAWDLGELYNAAHEKLTEARKANEKKKQSYIEAHEAEKNALRAWKRQRETEENLRRADRTLMTIHDLRTIKKESCIKAERRAIEALELYIGQLEGSLELSKNNKKIERKLSWKPLETLRQAYDIAIKSNEKQPNSLKTLRETSDMWEKALDALKKRLEALSKSIDARARDKELTKKKLDAWKNKNKTSETENALHIISLDAWKNEDKAYRQLMDADERLMDADERYNAFRNALLIAEAAQNNAGESVVIRYSEALASKIDDNPEFIAQILEDPEFDRVRYNIPSDPLSSER